MNSAAFIEDKDDASEADVPVWLSRGLLTVCWRLPRLTLTLRQRCFDRTGSYSPASLARDFAIILAFMWMASNLSGYLEASAGVVLEQVEKLLKVVAYPVYSATSSFATI
jgi:hypothetical protein